MTRTHPLDLERILHVPGEMLRSRDLRDQLTADLELMWWHQRAVHEAGVVAGLTVQWAQGDTTVGVGAGLAYDAQGLDLWLLEERRVTVPIVDSPTVLVVRRGRRGHEAEVVWLPMGALEPCDGIPLAVLDDSGTVRPRTTSMQTLRRPRIGSGATQPGATAWEPWRLDVLGARDAGIQVYVDTSGAGFTDLPCHFAWLNWPRPGDAGGGDVAFGSLGLQYLQNETVSGFTFHVLVEVAAEGRRLSRETALAFARRERLSVCWLGVECDPDTCASKRRQDGPVR